MRQLFLLLFGKLIFTTRSPTLNPSSYRPDIDGLRAIAVLSVVFYHDDLRFPGGYVGVDVFFVISGYLITGLILKDLAVNKFDLIEFWIRRIRRIFPAFFVVVVASIVAGAILLFPVDFQSLGQSIMAQTVLAANVYFLMHTGYFSGTIDLLPLLHTWSLAVEEQFYLFFPFLLIAFKRLPRSKLILITLVISTASLALSVYCSYYYPEANFYLLPSRAWELALGALPAMLVPCAAPRWQKEIISWVGLAGIAFAVVFYNRETRFPGLSAIPPCAGSALLIWANSGARTWAGNLLASPPMVFIGLISYSLYLWHWPLIVYAKYWTFGAPSMALRLTILLASIVLAAISWKWIETPFRHRVWFKGKFEILTFASLAAALLFLSGYIINHSNGFPRRFSPTVLAYMSGVDDHGIQPQLTLRDAIAGNFVRMGREEDKTSPPQVFLWGDSHAMAILPVLDVLCREYNVAGAAATHSATAPLLGYTSSFGYALKWDSVPYNQAVLNYIKKERIPDVLLVAMWGNYSEDTHPIHDCLINTICALRQSGARVWIMRQVPLPYLDVPRTLARDEVLGRQYPMDHHLPEDSSSHVSELEDKIFEGATAAGATILDPTDLLSDAQGQILLEENSKPLYSDGGHISITGSMRLRPLLEPVFAKKKPPLPPAHSGS